MECKNCKFAKPSGFYCEDAKLLVDKTGSCNKGEKRQDGWEVVRQIYKDLVAHRGLSNEEYMHHIGYLENGIYEMLKAQGVEIWNEEDN